MKSGYPACASNEEIEAWIDTKTAAFKMISSKIDLNERHQRAVNYQELMLS